MAGIMSFIPGRQSWIKLWYHDLNWIKKYAIKEFGAEKHLPIDKVGHCLLDFQLYICMDYNGLYMYGLERRHPTMGRLDEGI